LLLYPLLSFAFRQFLPALVPTKESDRPLTIGVPKGPARQDDEGNFRDKTHKALVESLFAVARRTELGEAAAVTGLLAPSAAPGPLLARDTVWAAFLAREVAHEPAVYLPSRFRAGAWGAKSHPEVVIKEVANPDKAMTDGDIDIYVLVFPSHDPLGPPLFAADWVIAYPEHQPRSRQLADYVEQHIAVANARKQRDQLAELGVKQP